MGDGRAAAQMRRDGARGGRRLIEDVRDDHGRYEGANGRRGRRCRGGRGKEREEGRRSKAPWMSSKDRAGLRRRVGRRLSGVRGLLGGECGSGR